MARKPGTEAHEPELVEEPLRLLHPRGAGEAARGGEMLREAGEERVSLCAARRLRPLADERRELAIAPAPDLVEEVASDAERLLAGGDPVRRLGEAQRASAARARPRRRVRDVLAAADAIQQAHRPRSVDGAVERVGGYSFRNLRSGVGLSETLCKWCGLSAAG